MVKYCPIMSYQTVDNNELYCMREECALWDEELKQCVIKTMATAAADKKNGGSGSTAQAYYIPPSSYCNTNAVSNTEVHLKPPATDDSYITF